MNSLPFKIAHVGTPPVKCQGIKTKLVPFIFSSIEWTAGCTGRWIEPFLGSGVVVLNLAPDRALISDTNKHIIELYRAIQDGELSQSAVREFLSVEGKKLEQGGADYYYEIRERFNACGSPFDFLFLNRSCFNGLMRFNKNGKFNTPFGHKPLRFSKSYITKIVNQIGWVARQMRGKDWEFRVSTWQACLREAGPDDFVYLDPPYIGRHTDYYNQWDCVEAEKLAAVTYALPCGFALSMWLENRHRRNDHIDKCWSDTEMRVCSHYYHVGASEELRNQMDEALLIKPGFASPNCGRQTTRKESTTDLQVCLAV